MRILGIDPGTSTTGYSVIEGSTDIDCKAITYGVITTSSKDTPANRLKIIFEDITQIIQIYKPQILSIEQLFFFKNSKTIITVSQARGVILLAGVQNNLKIVEYTPLQVKLTLTGYGKANKREIQEMVMRSLKLPELPKPDDAADALAVALCYLQNIFINN